MKNKRYAGIYFIKTEDSGIAEITVTNTTTSTLNNFIIIIRYICSPSKI